jgi:hypothetical protein
MDRTHLLSYSTALLSSSGTWIAPAHQASLLSCCPLQSCQLRPVLVAATHSPSWPLTSHISWRIQACSPSIMIRVLSVAGELTYHNSKLSPALVLTRFWSYLPFLPTLLWTFPAAPSYPLQISPDVPYACSSSGTCTAPTYQAAVLRCCPVVAHELRPLIKLQNSVSVQKWHVDVKSLSSSSTKLLTSSGTWTAPAYQAAVLSCCPVVAHVLHPLIKPQY